MNTLCESEVIGHKISDDPATAHVEEGIRIKPVNVGELLHLGDSMLTITKPWINLTLLLSTIPPFTELDEDGMRIGLTIVDTPGFGENIDNEYA